MVEINSVADPSAVLWRYMDLSKLISLIETSALHFNRVDNYEDPYEGWLPSGKFEEQQYGNHEDVPDAQDISLPSRVPIWELRKLVYTSCWMINKGQSDAMWSSYLSSNQGIAIQTTVGTLESQLPDTLDIDIGKVNYIDWNETEISIKDYEPLVLAFFKREAFKHENELRVAYRLSFDHEDVESRDEYKIESPLGEKISVDPETLIDTIYTSPRAPSWFTDTVEEMISSYDLDVDVAESSLLDTPIENHRDSF
jgi:hypothetical protein